MSGPLGVGPQNASVSPQKWVSSTFICVGVPPPDRGSLGGAGGVPGSGCCQGGPGWRRLWGGGPELGVAGEEAGAPSTHQCPQQPPSYLVPPPNTPSIPCDDSQCSQYPPSSPSYPIPSKSHPHQCSQYLQSPLYSCAPPVLPTSAPSICSPSPYSRAPPPVLPVSLCHPSDPHAAISPPSSPLPNAASIPPPYLAPPGLGGSAGAGGGPGGS